MAQAIDLWFVPLDGAARAEDEVLLSIDERERAQRLATPELRSRYAAGRAGLRRVLAVSLGVPPATLSFRVGEHGKPELAAHGLQFNLAHSHGLALVAVGGEHALGVDLEFVRPDVDFEALARRFFPDEDRALLARCAESDRRRLFFVLWTRKEALLKGLGRGMTAGLQVAPEDAARWSIREIAAPPGFVAALAVAGVAPGVRIREWPRDLDGGYRGE